MKNALFPLIIALILTGGLANCGSSSKLDDQADSAHPKGTATPNYTSEDLGGDWTLIKVEVMEEKQSIDRFKRDGGDPEIAEEWSPPVARNDKGILYPRDHYFFSISNRDLHIQGDSIYWLDYPCELEQSKTYTLQSDRLKIANNPDERQIHLSADRDTLSMSYMMPYGLYIKETYEKVTFDDSLLSILKRHQTNLPLLAGWWRVFKEGNINNDGSEYHLDFPYTIPDSVLLTAKTLSNAMLKGTPCSMVTDGKSRVYTVSYDLGGIVGDGNLTLSPSKWLPDNYEGDTLIHLVERLSIERQQASPQACWIEFLQVLASGNISNTVDLMTDDGYSDMRRNVPPQEMEITLKHRGQEWQQSEIRWENISKTSATAHLSTKGKERVVEMLKINGLWQVDAITEAD